MFGKITTDLSILAFWDWELVAALKKKKCKCKDDTTTVCLTQNELYYTLSNLKDLVLLFLHL